MRIFWLAVLVAVFPNASFAQTLKCTTVLECAREAVAVALENQRAVQIAVPRGAVMAFNLPQCPTGWAPLPQLAGRTIIGAGAGNRDMHDRPLTSREFGKTGGEEIHVLSVKEMPSHSHVYTFTDHCNTPKHTDCSHFEFGNSNKPTATSNTGGSQAHNNMPPFHVLTYCERQ